MRSVKLTDVSKHPINYLEFAGRVIFGENIPTEFIPGKEYNVNDYVYEISNGKLNVWICRQSGTYMSISPSQWVKATVPNIISEYIDGIEITDEGDILGTVLHTICFTCRIVNISINEGDSIIPFHIGESILRRCSYVELYINGEYIDMNSYVVKSNTIELNNPVNSDCVGIIMIKDSVLDASKSVNIYDRQATDIQGNIITIPFEHYYSGFSPEFDVFVNGKFVPKSAYNIDYFNNTIEFLDRVSYTFIDGNGLSHFENIKPYKNGDNVVFHFIHSIQPTLDILSNDAVITPHINNDTRYIDLYSILNYDIDDEIILYDGNYPINPNEFTIDDLRLNMLNTNYMKVSEDIINQYTLNVVSDGDVIDWDNIIPYGYDYTIALINNTYNAYITLTLSDRVLLLYLTIDKYDTTNNEISIIFDSTSVSELPNMMYDTNIVMTSPYILWYISDGSLVKCDLSNYIETLDISDITIKTIPIVNIMDSEINTVRMINLKFDIWIFIDNLNIIKFNTVTETFTTTPTSLTHGIDTNTTVSSLDDKIYLFCSSGDNGNEIQYFDINHLNTGVCISESYRYKPSVLEKNGLIYLVGGKTTRTSTSLCGDICIFNPTDDTLINTDKLISPSYNNIIISNDNDVFIIGGNSYDKTSDTYIMTQDMYQYTPTDFNNIYVIHKQYCQNNDVEYDGNEYKYNTVIVPYNTVGRRIPIPFDKSDSSDLSVLLFNSDGTLINPDKYFIFDGGLSMYNEQDYPDINDYINMYLLSKSTNASMLSYNVICNADGILNIPSVIDLSISTIMVFDVQGKYMLSSNVQISYDTISSNQFKINECYTVIINTYKSLAIDVVSNVHDINISEDMDKIDLPFIYNPNSDMIMCFISTDGINGIMKPSTDFYVDLETNSMNFNTIIKANNIIDIWVFRFLPNTATINELDTLRGEI